MPHMLPLGKLDPRYKRPESSRHRLLPAEEWKLLGLLARSPLADVPRGLITADQISRVLRGEPVALSPAQARAVTQKINGLGS